MNAATTHEARAVTAVYPQPRTRTDDMLPMIRNWHPTHEEAEDFFACLSASTSKAQSGLSDKCRAGVIDLIDQCFELVANDKIDQQAEQAWADQQRQGALCLAGV